MNISDLNKEIVNFIEYNKYKNGVGYEYSIGVIKELLHEIEEEYEKIGE